MRITMSEEQSSGHGNSTSKQSAEIRVYCLFCHQEIQNPRTAKGEPTQKFCSRKCKSTYHNLPKRKENIDAFVKDLLVLLDKHHFLRDYLKS